MDDKKLACAIQDWKSGSIFVATYQISVMLLNYDYDLIAYFQC